VAYTLLAVTGDGVVLGAYHLRRLGLDAEEAAPALGAFRRFAAEASPGVFALLLHGPSLSVESRPGTRLRDGMPARVAPSPVTDRAGPLPKPASPGPYDAVRQSGIATLLTSLDGEEIYEACSAAVLGWDGGRLVCVPDDRPRVWSTAEAAVREHLPVVERPILLRSRMPILLVNAVKGTCSLAAPRRDPFPTRAREEIERLFRSLTVGSGELSL